MASTTCDDVEGGRRCPTSTTYADQRCSHRRAGVRRPCRASGPHPAWLSGDRHGPARGSWLAVTGAADIVGPDDSADGIDADAFRLLLRNVFHAAGGITDDYDEFDRVTAAERRSAIFVAAERILGWG